jgi:hypothetical protein
MIELYTEEPHTFGDVPPADKLKPGVMWVISDEGGVCAVDFLCPCGCGSECYTPVTDATKGQPKTERHWLYSRGLGGVTLSPSIRYTGGCKAHFNITDGKTVMHGDSGR